MLSRAGAGVKRTRPKVTALSRAARFLELRVPVMLQIGTESPRDLYVTDALAAVLPDVRIQELPGQAHEAMTTAPGMYAEAVSRFLLS
jgi:pimeloyl-ACP methyl ester carboxylesterase